MKRKGLHYAWVILLALSLIRGVAGPGINASSGVFMSPVAEDFGVGIGTLSLYLSVSSIASFLWLPLGGALYEKKSVRLVALVAILAQSLAFIALGFMRSVWGFYILALPLSFGAILLVNLLGPLLVNRWFVKNVGLVMGLMMLITSLLGAVFQPTFTTLIARLGWRNSYITFGIFALAFMLICLVFLRSSPADKGLQPYGDGLVQTGVQTGGEGVAAKTALRSPAFFSLLLFMLVLTGFAAFQQHITTFGLGIGFPIESIGTALSLSMIGSALGSVLIGLLGDKLGAVPVSVGVLVVGLGSVLLFAFGGGVFAIFMLATFLHGLATSSIGVVAPLLTKRFFGNLAYEKIFSAVMLGSPLASVVLMPAYGFVYDRFGGYGFVFLFLVLALVVAVIGLLLGLRNSKALRKAAGA